MTQRMMSLKLLPMALVLTIASSALAAPDLGGTMKSIKASFMSIQRQIGTPAQDSATLALCDQMLADVEASKTFTPAKISDLPADELAVQMTAYTAILDQLKAKITDFKTKLVAGDRAGAQALISEMTAIRNDGHSKFKR
jgi:soluble cytochrome b562